MRNVIVLKGLTDKMIMRIAPEEVSNTEIAYSNVNTVLIMPTLENRVFIVFDTKSEWNYETYQSAKDIFARLAGQKRR